MHAQTTIESMSEWVFRLPHKIEDLSRVYASRLLLLFLHPSSNCGEHHKRQKEQGTGYYNS